MAIGSTTFNRISAASGDLSRPERPTARRTPVAAPITVAQVLPVSGTTIQDPKGTIREPKSMNSTISATLPAADKAVETLRAKPKGARSLWSDIELISAFQDGDELAYAEFYTRHKGEVYTYCVRMMGGDQDLASDVFQDIFIKVYEKAEQFRDGSNVVGWLFMIARNTCLNVFRARRPNETIDNHQDLASTDRSLAPEYDEEQHFLREKLEQAIAKLPEEFREPFVLREFDGFSYDEIAEMTGTTLGMTKVRIHRAKQKMRELLRPYIGE